MNKGFTFIEVMIVLIIVSIIGFLAVGTITTMMKEPLQVCNATTRVVENTFTDGCTIQVYGCGEYCGWNDSQSFHSCDDALAICRVSSQ